MKNNLLKIDGSRVIGKTESRQILAGNIFGCRTDADCPAHHSCVCLGQCLSWYEEDGGC